MAQNVHKEQNPGFRMLKFTSLVKLVNNENKKQGLRCEEKKKIVYIEATRRKKEEESDDDDDDG